MADGVREEVEWEFEATDLEAAERALPWVVALPLSVRWHKVSEIHDEYLDTADRLLSRAAWALRIRRADGSYEVTLKSKATGVAGGPRRRREISQTLPDGKRSQIVDADGAVGAIVRELCGASPLEPLFLVETVRRRWTLLLDGHDAGEVEFDTSAIHVGDKTETLQRVEIETEAVTFGSLLAERLARRCGLQTAARSKFEVGVLLIEQQRVALSLDLRVGDVASRFIDRAGTRFEAALERVGHAADGEAVHDARVAIRRLRSTLWCYRRYLPRQAARSDRRLRSLAQSLGELRDIEVVLQALGSLRTDAGMAAAPLAAALAALDARYEQRRQAFAATIDTSVQKPPTAGRRVPAKFARRQRQRLGKVVPRLLRDQERRLRGSVRRLNRRASSTRYHGVRIEAKRLRYILAPIAQLYGQEARDLVGALKRLQDALGRAQDARLIRTMSHELFADLPGAAELVDARYREEQRSAQRDARAELQPVASAWKALRHAVRWSWPAR